LRTATVAKNAMNIPVPDVSVSAWQIRLEQAADAGAVEALNADSFGPGRFAKSAYRLREGVAPVAGLSFVAVEQMGGRDVLRGSVRFWPIKVGGHEELLLGPLAVDGDQRGRGIGIALMQAGLEAARQGPWRGVLLVGDEPYYTRVGFSRLPPGRVKFPGPVDQNRILGLSLKAGELLNLAGEVRRAQIDEAVCAAGAGVG
jgi:predicted N-acetyltransferase YhbS